MTRSALALPLQPDLLTGRHAGRNLDVEFLPARQPDALLGTVHGFLERHRHGDAEIEIRRAKPAAIEFEGLRTGATTAATRAARRRSAEHAIEDVLETAAAEAAARAASAGTEIEILEPGAACTARARAAAGKALKSRLALGVDLATVELFALGLVAKNLVGRIHLGKARGGLRIVLVGVGVMLLRKLAKGAFDRRRACAPLHPQDLIGVAHPSRLLRELSEVGRLLCPLRLHLGVSWHFCNGAVTLI